MREFPTTGQIYEHFKGGRYEVICVAKMEDNRDEERVIYKSLQDGSIWARELFTFLSDVDEDKYPDHAGKFRMTLIK